MLLVDAPRNRRQVRRKPWSPSRLRESTSSTCTFAPDSTSRIRRSFSGARRRARSRASGARSPRLLQATVSPTRWCAGPVRARTPALAPAAQLVKIPAEVDFATAAAVMLQGTTAHYLTHSTFPLKAGNTCLVHAAAGGTGGLIVQMARHLGARVLGTVSTEEKARQVRALGADETINYTTQDFESEVKRLTGGRGVDVVYDSVGKTTFDKSLNVLRPRRRRGALRSVERLGAALRSGHPQRPRLALSHPPQPRAPPARPEGTPSGASTTSSATSLPAPSRCASLARIRCLKPRARTAISKVGERPGSCC